MNEEQLMKFMAMLKQLAPQQQQGPDLSQLASLLQPKSRHLGIGGAEITADNPTGNLGGNPFTNGFFNRPAQAAPQFTLGGSPRPDAGQLALLGQMKRAQMPQSPQIPQGDPVARAFWGKPTTPEVGVPLPFLTPWSPAPGDYAFATNKKKRVAKSY